MTKPKVLVFPSSSEIGLELHRSLKNDKSINLIGLSSPIDNIGRMFFKEHYQPFPKFDDENFIDEIQKFIDDKKIDIIIPAHDDATLLLSKNKNFLNAKVITSDYNVCEICRDKSKTYQHFAGDSVVKVPRVYHLYDLSSVQFPLFVKPKIGQGSKGAKLIKNYMALEAYIDEQGENHIIMEYLPGEEFTVDCYTDFSGILRYCGPRVRNSTINGISSDTRAVDSSELEFFANAIMKKLPLRGPWFFQAKKDRDGKYTLLEIAPRIAGSSAVSRNVGINIPALAVHECLGHSISLERKNYNIKMKRTLLNSFELEIDYDTLYIDLDDTIIVDDKVNIEAIQLLHQCINERKRIVLLTKHKGNLATVLKQHRISDLFDEILQIKHEEEKFSFVTSKKSILVDDSFTERMKVFSKLGIHVFDVSEIESLLKRTA